MQQVLLVALGGAFGAVARYGVAFAAVRLGADAFPWGTWAANLLGCFLIGLVLPFVLAPQHETARLLAVTGFLGAFTTFSTFSLDTFSLGMAGRPGLALLNALGSVAAGLVLVWLGVLTARAFGAP
ncbi:MAG: fluoride efflux transporter CrcB [Rhodothermaceae bacterium]|nr:fluoride efflux transporter CrcB [Rhodothermaceae bacterium]